MPPLFAIALLVAASSHPAAAPAAVAALAAAAPAVAAPSDSTPSPRRVVRTFPAIEVRALLPDLRSNQTAHPIPAAVLRSFPVRRLADVVALQPGVVVEGEELHVRGGRSGETGLMLDGLRLVEPRLHRTLDVPLIAVREAQLVTGIPDARYGGSLGGTLDLRTLDPTARPSLEWRWTTDGRTGTHYDRAEARVSGPLGGTGLGAVVAGDATLDDTALPFLRTPSRHALSGLSFGWRAENRMLGSFKLAPVRDPERFSATVLASRQVSLPYDPAWSYDGWVFLPENLKDSPVFSTEPLPGYLRYRAADHRGISDDRQLATVLQTTRRGDGRSLRASAGWVRTRGTLSVSGQREPEWAAFRPRYGRPVDRDQFHVLYGDFPLYRESDTDVYALALDAEQTRRTGSLTAGVGLTREHARLREVDWSLWTQRSAEVGLTLPVDSVRAFDATAPGAYAYLQGRWTSGGLVANAGLRAEYWTPGPQATSQTLPGEDRGVWTFDPRVGLAYPLTLRDVFSFAYTRLHQAPSRDRLYDRRVAINDRQPLGNPALRPAELISYEAAVKHVFGPTWALQGAVFYRDLYGLVGAVDLAIPDGPINLQYTDSDHARAVGFEWSVMHASERARFEAHYTWMEASGNESRPGGDPYGLVRKANLPTITDAPLSWDRRHTVTVGGAWQRRSGLDWSWTTSVGSPLPWTPKQRRVRFTDLGLVNSRRLGWVERTDLDVTYGPRFLRGARLGLEVRNLFDGHAETGVTVDGYPSEFVNTLYDDYGAYRTETGNAGGAYWWAPNYSTTGVWVPVHDPRLFQAPRTVRLSIGARW